MITARQLEVFELASQGLSNKQIARHLGLKEGSVKCYRHDAMNKLGAATAAHAVALLMSRGFFGRCSVSASVPESIVVTGWAA